MHRFPVTALAIHLMVLTWVAFRVSLITDKTYTYTYTNIYTHKFALWLLAVMGYTILVGVLGRLMDTSSSNGKDRNKLS